MRANNLLLVWAIAWIVLSGIVGAVVYIFYTIQVFPGVFVFIGFFILKMLEKQLGNAVYKDKLDSEMLRLAKQNATIPKLPVAIEDLRNCGFVQKYFKLVIYSEDAATLVARIRRDVSYYLIAGILTTAFFVLYVARSEHIAGQEKKFEMDFGLVVPLTAILIAALRVWIPLQDMATRHEPIVGDG